MKTTSRRFRAVALLLAGCLFLTSCASGGAVPSGNLSSDPGRYDPGRPLTPAEQRMRQQANDFDRTLAEGVAIGALTGAAMGAGIGAAASKNNRAAGALIGGVIGLVGGGIAGALAGSYYGKKKLQYANEEQRLDSVIADAKADNQKTEALLADTRTVIAADKQELDKVKKDLAAKRISREEANERLTAVDANREALADQISKLNTRRDEWRAVTFEITKDSNNSRISDLNEQVGKLDSQITLMQRELDAINGRRATIVG